MADPTKSNRAALINAAAKILPNSPIGQSAQAKIAADEEQLKIDEANNLVMQREQPNLPAEALAFTNPADANNTLPVVTQPEVSQAVNTQAAVPAIAPTERAPASDGFDKLTSALDANMANAEKRHLAQEQERTKRINDVTAKLDQIEQRGPFKFDDRSLWAKETTGGRVALLVGGFLSSLDKSGARSFQEGVKSAIERDLAMQNKMFDEGKTEKNSLLNQLNQQLGNREAANAAWESMVYKGITDKLAFQMQHAQSQQQREQAAEAHGLSKEKFELDRAIALNKASTPKELDASGRVRFDAAREALQSVRDMRSQLAKGSNTFSIIGENPYTLSRSKFAENYGRMQSGGAISKDEQERFESFAPNFKDSKEMQLMKLNRLEKELAGRIATLGQKDVGESGQPSIGTRY